MAVSSSTTRIRMANKIVSPCNVFSKSSMRGFSRGAELAQQQLVSALELIGSRGGHRLGSGGAIQARVDGLVGLACQAAQVGDEACAAVAQALASFKRRGGGRRSQVAGRRSRRLRRGRLFVEQLQRVVGRMKRRERLVEVRARRQRRELQPLCFLLSAFCFLEVLAGTLLE